MIYLENMSASHKPEGSPAIIGSQMDFDTKALKPHKTQTGLLYHQIKHTKDVYCPPLELLIVTGNQTHVSCSATLMVHRLIRQKSVLFERSHKVKVLS